MDMAQDKVTTDTIRLINAAVKDKDINARSTGNKDGIADAGYPRRNAGHDQAAAGSAEIYAKNARPELAAQEDGEIAVIQRFLPQQMSEAEVRVAIDALIAETGAKDIKDMGKVMGAMKSKYAGQMDMAKAGAWIKEKLAA